MAVTLIYMSVVTNLNPLVRFYSHVFKGMSSVSGRDVIHEYDESLSVSDNINTGGDYSGCEASETVSDNEHSPVNIRLETRESTDIMENVKIRRSDLDGYFRDERKGRAVNVYRCGELSVEGGLFGVVNNYAIDGVICDIERSVGYIPDEMKISFSIADGLFVPENYMVFKSFETDEKDPSYHLLMPLETEYGDDCVYIRDDGFSENRVNTYALVNTERLRSFHNLVNGKYSDDIFESQMVNDNVMRYFDIEYIQAPDFSQYSENDDDDGDELSNRLEKMLGLDPENKSSYGSADCNVKYLQKLDPEVCGSFNGGNSSRKFFAEVVGSGDVSKYVTVGKSQYDELFRDDRNGRRVSVSLDGGTDIDVIYRGRITPSAIIGDIAEISISENDNVKYVRAGFELPDVPEEELQYYRIATSTKDDSGNVYLVSNEETSRTDHSVFYVYNRDVKSVCLVDMRIIEKFAEETNMLEYDAERELSVYCGDFTESNIVSYDFY